MKDYSVLDGMARHTKDCLTSAYNKGYSRGYEDGWAVHKEIRQKDMYMGYEQGLKDAWECVLKIGKLDVEQQKSIFGTYTTRQIALAFTVQQAIQKVKEYEERQTEKSCENCFFYGHCKYYGMTLTWLLGDKNEQTGEKVCKSWKPNR